MWTSTKHLHVLVTTTITHLRTLISVLLYLFYSLPHFSYSKHGFLSSEMTELLVQLSLRESNRNTFRRILSSHGISWVVICSSASRKHVKDRHFPSQAGDNAQQHQSIQTGKLGWNASFGSLQLTKWLQSDCTKQHRLTQQIHSVCILGKLDSKGNSLLCS